MFTIKRLGISLVAGIVISIGSTCFEYRRMSDSFMPESMPYGKLVINFIYVFTIISIMAFAISLIKERLLQCRRDGVKLPTCEKCGLALQVVSALIGAVTVAGMCPYWPLLTAGIAVLALGIMLNKREDRLCR